MTWITKDQAGNIIGKDREKPKAAEGTVIEWDDTPYEDIVLHQQYDEIRVKSYPTTGDQLDALWKIINALVLLPGVTIPDDAQAIMDQVNQVKQDNPKE